MPKNKSSKTKVSVSQFPKDEIGPAYIIRTYDPKLDFEGILVIDNLNLGLGKGGIRMTPDVSMTEVFRLARAMSFKNALAELPFGGAKAGIVWDPHQHTLDEKRAVMESFSRSLKAVIPRLYIAGPDINTSEREMQWFAMANGNWKSATGKPANYCMEVFGKGEKKCGIPHEFGSTGFGVVQTTKVAAEFAGVELKGATAGIAGFGNVGMFAMKHLEEIGVKTVAVSGRDGVIFNPKGIDYKNLMKLKDSGKSIMDYKDAKKIDREAIYELKLDILIPAATPDVIHEKNYKKVKSKIIVEGANIPMNEKYEEYFHKNGTLIVPDIIANAGGVISSYAEYRGYNPKRMFETVEAKIVKNVRTVLAASKKEKRSPRKVAMEIAKKRILSAKRKVF